ncbi:hypothetical protein V1514DRAFT_331919 [Lipomyces japonicus]|uniref:uncharacterized protein n=1 Tax=Lipomyces japonicus TaxID=56871 RepID=UPI0034CE1388
MRYGCFFFWELVSSETTQKCLGFAAFILMPHLKFLSSFFYYPVITLFWCWFIILKYLVFRLVDLVNFLVGYARNQIFNGLIKSYIVSIILFAAQIIYHVLFTPVQYVRCYVIPTVNSAGHAGIESCIGILFMCLRVSFNLHYSAQFLLVLCAVWFATWFTCSHRCHAADRYLLFLSFPFYLGLTCASSYRMSIFQFNAIIPFFVTVFTFWLMRIVMTSEFQIFIETNGKSIDKNRKLNSCSHVIYFFVFYSVIAALLRWIICPMTSMIVFNLFFLIVLQAYVPFVIVFPFSLWFSFKLGSIIDSKFTNKDVYKLIKGIIHCHCHDDKKVRFLVVHKDNQHVQAMPV